MVNAFVKEDDHSKYVLLLFMLMSGRHNRGTYTFVRKMTALPFLPERQIEPMFETLPQGGIALSEPLLKFVGHISSFRNHQINESNDQHETFIKDINNENANKGKTGLHNNPRWRSNSFVNEDSKQAKHSLSSNFRPNLLRIKV